MPHFASWATAWWKPVLFIVVAGHLTNVSVTLFLHRAQTHRGVRLHYLAALPMRLWLWLSTAIVTKEWVACHRKHHAFADREGDPHSPLLEGLRNIVLKGAFYYRKAVRQPGVLEKYGIEIAEDFTLPPALDDAWHTRGYYGSVSHNVKAVYQRYLGWFDGHPSSLWQHPPVAAATRYAQAFGG